MPLTHRTCARWAFSLLSFCLLLPAASRHFWESADPSSWSAEQVAQFTTDSPWAKHVTAQLVSNQSNMVTGQTRADGRRGTRGSAPSLPSPSALPKLQAVVRWASAKPMQEVLRLKLPEGFAGHYVLSVSGLPVGGDQAEIAEGTTLQVKRGEPIHPDAAFQDPDDSSTIYFAYLPSLVNVESARSALFEMLAAPYSVKAKFNLSEMHYHGAPAL